MNTGIKPVVRFAPSPNGYLHLGHALSALRNSDFAAQSGGVFLLRIEDIDTGRARPRYEQAIYEDLAWLGLEWAKPVRRQSRHFSFYAEALERLKREGLLYPCYCSRQTIASAIASRPDWPCNPVGSPLYPGLCKPENRQLHQRFQSDGAPAAWRLDVSAAMARVKNTLVKNAFGWCEFGESDRLRNTEADPALWGDVILGRKDVPASYHLAVVMDDALQGVTDIIRGADLFASTSLHRLLQSLLALPVPAYHHHRLLLDEHGRKLAKSRGSTALRQLRAAGCNPSDVRRMTGIADKERSSGITSEWTDGSGAGAGDWRD